MQYDEIQVLARRNSDAAASKGMESEETRADTTVDIAQIVAGCQQNDRNAQRQLYERYQQRVYRLMVRMAGTDDAADLTQRAFLHVFGTIGQFAGHARFDTWLYRVATNEALQHLRRRRRHPTASLAEDPRDRRTDRTQTIELRELLDQALQRVDAQLRSLFLLREVEELSYQEIAEVLGIPEGTVGSRLNRVRSELRQHLIALGCEG
jgi:RNA polymerase sigma-70 factor (ECF subfamily)